MKNLNKIFHTVLKLLPCLLDIGIAFLLHCLQFIWIYNFFVTFVDLLSLHILHFYTCWTNQCWYSDVGPNVIEIKMWDQTFLIFRRGTKLYWYNMWDQRFDIQTLDQTLLIIRCGTKRFWYSDVGPNFIDN